MNAPHILSLSLSLTHRHTHIHSHVWLLVQGLENIPCCWFWYYYPNRSQIFRVKNHDFQFRISPHSFAHSVDTWCLKKLFLSLLLWPQEEKRDESVQWTVQKAYISFAWVTLLYPFKWDTCLAVQTWKPSDMDWSKWYPGTERNPARLEALWFPAMGVFQKKPYLFLRAGGDQDMGERRALTFYVWKLEVLASQGKKRCGLFEASGAAAKCLSPWNKNCVQG